ncbi:MAG: sulfurtransferase complex subunit TusC [Pseudomonadota bacterium]
MNTIDRSSITPKPTAIMLRQAPYGKPLANEALEAVLGYAAFAQDISVFFIGDGVFQLLQEQDAEKIGQKSLEKRVKALSLYDVKKLYVCQNSLEKRGLSANDLCVDITVVDPDTLSLHLREQDTLLSF